MKVIVTGSRHITDYSLVSQVIYNTLSKYNINITELVSGGTAGPDILGEQWALENSIPIEVFEAEWDNLNVPGAKIKINKWGEQYNALAGFQRNEKMVEYSDVLIAIWDGKSSGTKDIIERAKKHGLFVLVYNT